LCVHQNRPLEADVQPSAGDSVDGLQRCLRVHGVYVSPKAFVAHSLHLCGVGDRGAEDVDDFGSLVNGLGAVEEYLRALIDDDQC
jgi:hypothetical protein